MNIRIGSFRCHLGGRKVKIIGAIVAAIISFSLFSQQAPSYKNYTVKTKYDSRERNVVHWVDIVLKMKVTEHWVSYINDASITTHLENKGPTQGENPIPGSYDISNNYLYVSNRYEHLVKTPVLSSEFNNQSRGWFVDDQRIVVKGRNIGILHLHDSNVWLAYSNNDGKTWNRSLLYLDPALRNISFGHLEFIDDTYIVALKSYVAINSEIQSFHASRDGG